MDNIILKNSELKISRIAMGGCPLGEFGWGVVQESELIKAIHASIDGGCNFFDTADTYGLGRSEINLGKALAGRRSEAVIATKFGVRVEGQKTYYDNSPRYIREALEKSLKRLNVDCIDLYQIHYRDKETPLESVVEVLEEMKEKGRVRCYGLSNIYQTEIGELKKYSGKFVSFQDEYSLACRKNEEDILKIQEKIQMTPFTWGSLGQGILTGKYNEDSIFEKNDRRSRDTYINFHGQKLKKNLKIVETMRQIAVEIQENQGIKIPLSAIAIRFILDRIPESVVIAGAKCPLQAADNLSAFGWKLEKEQIQRLEMISR